ncbi:MAG TPA: hypothetical protein DEH78_23645 [Solibacterales bacterium]|nr:hypothetical protein [Bryobacterales bacterium]
MARILLVDDDPDQLSIRGLLLEREGHCVELAASAAQAEEALLRATPGLVLMDLRIPTSADGLALIRAIHAHSAQVPIVVLSGWMDDLNKAPESRLVSTCLRKPARSERVLRIVAGLTQASGE